MARKLLGVPLIEVEVVLLFRNYVNSQFFYSAPVLLATITCTVRWTSKAKMVATRIRKRIDTLGSCYWLLNISSTLKVLTKLYHKLPDTMLLRAWHCVTERGPVSCKQ